MMECPIPSCPVCGASLKVATNISKRGKVSISLVCSRDGRDFRAFINNQEYVRKVLDSLEDHTPSLGTGVDVDADSTPDSRSKTILERLGD